MFSGPNLQSGQTVSDKITRTPINYNNSLKAYQTSQFTTQKLAEREELKNLHRNLKVQLNMMQDENLRLKTRLQAMATELQRKEKDSE